VYLSSQPQFPSAWRQKQRLTDAVTAVKQSLQDCEASLHLPSWASGPVHGAEEAAPILPVFTLSYASVSVLVSFCWHSDDCNSSKIFVRLEVDFHQATVTGRGPVTGCEPAQQKKRSLGVEHCSFIVAVNT